MGIRTISCVKAYYEPEELDPAELIEARKEALRIARMLATDLKRLEADDNASQTEIEDLVMRIYRISALIDPDMLPGMVDDDSISSGEALKIDRALSESKFRDSIRTEVLCNLINDTGTLEEVSEDTVRSYNGNYTFIHTVVKCKRKKADNSYDKHKARTAARGDEYLRKLLQRGKQPPPLFSPTINALTFQYILQVATAKNMVTATQDIKGAYLNAPLPDTDEPIITKLDDSIADICGLPRRGQLYRIRKSLYGLPQSGRI